MNRNPFKVGRLVSALLVMLPLAFASSALARHREVDRPGRTAEIDTDAKLKADDAAPSIDWANVGETRKADTASEPTNESFGQGTRE